MKVYHGSYTHIDTIDLSKCKPLKDFGKGFYVTKIRHHADSWANVIGEKNSAEKVKEIRTCLLEMLQSK